MSENNVRYAWFDGAVVPLEQAKISVHNQALQYGTSVFAGMRAYWNAEREQLYLFRPFDHFERLLQSAALLRLDLNYTPAQLLQSLIELLQAERVDCNCYIRPLVYAANESLGVHLLDSRPELAITLMPLRDGGFVSKAGGMHVCISAWRRVEDNAIPARGKIAGSYVNSLMIRSDAMLAGYDDAIVLNNDGHIAECSVANLFLVRKGVAITPPVTADVLEGIVRRSLIHLLQEELNVEVQERPVDRTEAYLADEMFMCGTGAEITPVTRVEHRPVGDGEIGALTSRLSQRFLDIVYGRDSRYMDWLEPVFALQRAVG
ncbi:MAG: branched-chain amino acid transaminase [Anaerolineaceae bacterium]|nr:branched-chain amino acid transaminase [Anaerolineaceae bacterium]